MPQTNETISAASRPKFTMLCGLVEEILLLHKFFFRLSIRALFAKIYSPKQLCDGTQTAIFWASEPRAAHFRHAF